MAKIRKGLGKGTGKGYKNIIPNHDKRVHTQSRMGIKQPQRIPHVSMRGIPNRDFMLSKWETKQDDNQLIQRELSKDYAFGNRSFGEVSIVRIPPDEYIVGGKLYDW